jgi:acyl carrier protein phosphodiesterase
MNFLAHLFLSGDDSEMKIGNFIADAVKGNDWADYRPGIGKGIRLHRAIDSYTDYHPVVRRSTQRLQGKFHKYSGIIIDMLYDHYLALHWSDYHAEPLATYVDSAYNLMMDNYEVLPVRAQKVLKYMMEGNWLLSYADLDSLDRYYQGMARRTPYASGMENAISEIRKHYDQFEGEFRSFFPEIRSFVGVWIQNGGMSSEA